MTPQDFKALLAMAREYHHEGPHNHVAIVATMNRAELLCELWEVCKKHYAGRTKYEIEGYIAHDAIIDILAKLEAVT